MTPSISVVITTYQRPQSLAACLDGIREQARPADEVLVVAHAEDQPSVEFVGRRAEEWPALRLATVDRDGSVAALNRGLAAARGEIVAIIDDDAVAHPDWLERMATGFDGDERIAAVGGRDVIVVDGQIIGARRRRLVGRRSRAPAVGRIQWFGRMIANHHLGAGGPRDVDVLKGVNMGVRRAAVIGHGYDERLRGKGAVVHTELSICLPLRRRRLRVVYDPAIVVNHYPAPRPHGDERVGARQETTFAAAHNEALAILDYFDPARRLVFVVWGLAVGTTDAPGLAVLARDCLERRSEPWRTFTAAQRGRLAALRTRRTPRTVPSPLAFDRRSA
jgi:GT2 family glycosyltransferase